MLYFRKAGSSRISDMTLTGSKTKTKTKTKSKDKDKDENKSAGKTQHMLYF